MSALFDASRRTRNICQQFFLKRTISKPSAAFCVYQMDWTGAFSEAERREGFE